MTLTNHRSALAVLALLALVGGVPSARADSAAASCEVRKEGETRKGASGPCTFSQRQGYITLALRNGDSFSLEPTGEPGQYRDQKGNKVVRTLTGGGTEQFKWEGGRKILLTYAGQSGTAAPAHAAAPRGEPDRFDSICAVIVDGKHHRYRCSVTDFLSGGQKVATELRYPDQTIELTWRPGNRVGLQFEGMVPMETTYSTYEGETNFVFEGKTYYYYSSKDLARREVAEFRD
jgi:hypothetical protein